MQDTNVRSGNAGGAPYPGRSVPKLLLFAILLAGMIGSAELVNQLAPVQPASPVPETAGTSSFVSDAPPDIPEDPYPLLHAVRLNSTPEALREERIPEFTRTCPLAANATGLLVRVDRAHLILSWNVVPQNDCLANPASCRGSLAHPVQRPHFTISVRDAATTKELVLEDGYGRKYSSDTNRTMKIYREGSYHITLTGEFLEMKLGIATGASPLAHEMDNRTVPAGPEGTTNASTENQFWF